MVECEAWQQLLPARRGVTVFAALGFERAFVGIDVAVGAGIELHVLVACRPTRLIRLVAFFASDLDVETGQRIARLRMVKLIRGFPIRKVVALQAVVAELALMHIFVARHAILRQSEKGPGEILHLNERTLVRNHISGHVTLLTGNAGVLSFQVVARQPVVKLFLRRLPVDQVEIRAIVLQMAANAVLPVWVAHLDLEVISVLAAETSGDFFVAIQALEGRRGGAELVAARTLCGPGEGLVGFRKRARRNLCERGRGKANRDKEKN